MKFEMTCFALPKEGKFTIGDTYTVEECRTNDICFYKVNDDYGKEIVIYEWPALSRSFK